MTGGGRVAVLGASGFVGSAVCADLVASGTWVRSVARSGPGVRGVADVRLADLTDPGAVTEATAGVDAIVVTVLPSGGWRAVGAGAPSLDEAVVHAVVAAAARRPGPAPVVVAAGSVTQVGIPPSLPLSGAEPDRPDGPYERGKLAAERALLAATADGVVRGTVLRLPTVYGPAPSGGRPDRGVLAGMTRRALAGHDLPLWNGGTVRRDFVTVSDVADALTRAIGHADVLAGRSWLVGTGVGIPLRDAAGAIADDVAALTARPRVGIRHVPAPEDATATDLAGVVVDPRPFTAAVGWRPRTSWRDGVRDLVEDLARPLAGV